MNLKEGYNGDLTSREAGSIGGQMVKMIAEPSGDKSCERCCTVFPEPEAGSLCFSGLYGQTE